MTSSKETKNKTWPDLINESVHTNDDRDIGDIYAVNKDFIVVKQGFINIHYYYIPIIHVEGWDDNVLWLNISEEKVKKTYERDDSSPDPSRYYLKDNHKYDISYLSELRTISSKMAEPAYSFDVPVTTTPSTNPSSLDSSIDNTSSRLKCDLCNKTNFITDDELSNHINSEH
jgi:hypothetical protein